MNKRNTLDSQFARRIIEASLDPLVTISAEGKITDMNQATIDITGDTREELTGNDFFKYFTQPQKAREVYQEVFANESVVDSPLTLRNNNGQLTDVLFNGSVYKDDQGTVLGVVIVARDVTDQKRKATELKKAKVAAESASKVAKKATKVAEKASRVATEAQNKAEKAAAIAQDAVKAKQQFLSNMSHEIRTPMNAIIGFTKVLLKTELTNKQEEYLNAIKLSGDALVVLIDDILDLAKVGSGKMTFEQTPFKLSKSISAMLHLFETKIQEKNIQLSRLYDHNIPDVLIGDPVRLHQIMLNLISNAVKFTNSGKITVKVELVREDKKTAVVNFAIIDTGIGIGKDKLPAIFENFQQATSGTSRLYGGTGLGLAIVKQLVESQGGSIHVDSILGHGSTFSFNLTFKKTTSKIELKAENAEWDSEHRELRILVVEDIPLNQLLMRTVLEDYGFVCEVADNGRIAIEILESNEFDIVLMDLQMPEMNGFEATDYIRNILNLQVPIIALTADVTTVDLEKCTSVGMDDYIAKPLDEKLLYRKIVFHAQKGLSTPPVVDSNVSKAEINKIINLDYLHLRTKSNPALMMQMISLYLKQTPPLIDAMKQGIENKDWNAMRAAAHKIIPSFSIMGLNTEFEDMAKKVQEYQGLQPGQEQIIGWVQQIETACLQACKELKEEYAAIEKNIQ
ncbi:MAG: ATP-binding protein [Bacteroidales bacterium]